MNGHTLGTWNVYNMVHHERGDAMTPEEVGEYVKNCMLKSVEDGGTLDRFLFVSTGEGEPDICHVGNGPRGPANARLIAAAPELLEAAEWLIAYETAMNEGHDVEAMVAYSEASKRARAAIAKATRGDQ